MDEKSLKCSEKNGNLNIYVSLTTAENNRQNSYWVDTGEIVVNK